MRTLLYAFSALALTLGVLLLLTYPGRRTQAVAAVGITLGVLAPIAYRYLAREE